MSRRPSNRPRAVTGSIAVLMCVFTALAGLLPVTAAQTAVAASTTTMFAAAPSALKLSSDRSATEVGTVFTATVSGKVTAIRFYKVSGVKGKHTGTLWSKSGKKLARVTFKKESASGWQTAKLAKAVSLKAGKSYVVSYHVSKNGRYVVATSAKAVAAVTNSASSGLKVTKGVYKHTGKIAFPKKSAPSGKNLVDVVYTPSSSSKTTAPDPTTSTSPSTGSGTATFPTRTSVGLPSGWSPTRTITGDYTISTAGAVVEDLKVVDGTIYVRANNVTLRRVQGVGAFVKTDPGNSCSSGLVIEDSEFTKNGKTSDQDPPVIGDGGYTIRRSVVDNRPEGLRAGGTDIGCGQVTVEDTYVRVVSPDSCSDWHGDGLQGYGGDKVVVRNSTFVMSVVGDCYGTAPFFYPKNQGNTSVDIDGMLVSGGGYPFRNGMPGTVKNLNVVDGSWVYGPVDVNCSALSAWSAQTVKLASDGSTTPVRSISCTGQGN